jgi:diaminopimelate epimerase
MRFAKYHGLGNDFLVVDLRDAAVADAGAAQDPAKVVALCDRQFGVGGDGVLAILPSTIADARMRVLNSDGGEAEMCGNGLRCVARELYERGGLHKPVIAIETGAGVLECRIEERDGAVATVTVEMGVPRLLRAEIPMIGPPGERCVEQAIDVAGSPRTITCVSMGNPHAITFVGSRDDAFRLARALGPTVEHHASFPNRTNAEFAHMRSRREIDLVVWERGCGITLACGTGACATAVAAIVTGHADEETPIRVHLPGGALTIRVHNHLAGVAMTGPAIHAFDGVVDLARLSPRP